MGEVMGPQYAQGSIRLCGDRLSGRSMEEYEYRSFGSCESFVERAKREVAVVRLIRPHTRKDSGRSFANGAIFWNR